MIDKAMTPELSDALEALALTAFKLIIVCCSLQNEQVIIFDKAEKVRHYCIFLHFLDLIN